MHIVLLILKIIGAILGGLLGLVLLLILLLLFVPVRYHAVIKVQEQVKVDSSFSWLLHVVHARIRYEEKKLNYTLRIFGILVKQNKDNVDSKKAKPKKQRKKKEKSVPKEQKKQEPGSKEAKKDKSVPIKQEEQSKQIEQSKYIEQSECIEQTGQTQQIQQSESTVKLAEKENVSSSVVNHNSNAMNGKKETKKVKKKIAFHPIRMLKGFFEKIKSLFENIKLTFIKIKRTIKNLIDKKNKIMEFIKKEQTKNSFRKTKKVLFGWVRYIAPRKLKGYVQFGTGDPCETGQLLGIISIFSAKYQPKFSVYPDFEKKILKADLRVHGRMSFIRFVRDGAGWYFDKEVKKCIADIKQLKEEL